MIPVFMLRCSNLGKPVRRRPAPHPVGRRPLAPLEQGERRPTGSRAAGLGSFFAKEKPKRKRHIGFELAKCVWNEV